MTGPTGYPGTRATRFSAYPAYPGYPAYPVFIDTQDIHIRKHDAKYVYKLKNTIEKIIYWWRIKWLIKI